MWNEEKAESKEEWCTQEHTGKGNKLHKWEKKEGGVLGGVEGVR